MSKPSNSNWHESVLNALVACTVIAMFAGLGSGCSSHESTSEQAANAAMNADPMRLQHLVETNAAILGAKADFDGSTLLHMVAARAFVTTNTLASAKVFVDAGIDVNLSDLTGRTPLHLACEFNTGTNLIGFLLSNGANANAKDNSGKSPLYYARTSSRSTGAIALLEAYGAKE